MHINHVANNSHVTCSLSAVYITHITQIGALYEELSSTCAICFTHAGRENWQICEFDAGDMSWKDRASYSAIAGYASRAGQAQPSSARNIKFSLRGDHLPTPSRN